MRASLGVGLVVATLVAALPTRAAAEAPPAGVVDRIVAVVGKSIILLSDVRAREAPFLLKLDQEKGPPAEQAARRAEMEKELLSRMVDETLEAAFAAVGHIGVTPDEVDHAEASVAQQNNLTVDRLEDEALKQGLSRRDYRAEIARQVLEGKLVQMEVLPRIQRDPKQTEADRVVLLERERGHWLEELRRATHIDTRL
jgi:peptidyl-prolyl cis-trans isomerase SurA